VSPPAQISAHFSSFIRARITKKLLLPFEMAVINDFVLQVKIMSLPDYKIFLISKRNFILDPRKQPLPIILNKNDLQGALILKNLNFSTETRFRVINNYFWFLENEFKSAAFV